jgi:hypothetical protein
MMMMTSAALARVRHLSHPLARARC